VEALRPWGDYDPDDPDDGYEDFDTQAPQCECGEEMIHWDWDLGEYYCDFCRMLEEQQEGLEWEEW